MKERRVFPTSDRSAVMLSTTVTTRPIGTDREHTECPSTSAHEP